MVCLYKCQLEKVAESEKAGHRTDNNNIGSCDKWFALTHDKSLHLLLLCKASSKKKKKKSLFVSLDNLNRTEQSWILFRAVCFNTISVVVSRCARRWLPNMADSAKREKIAAARKKVCDFYNNLMVKERCKRNLKQSFLHNKYTTNITYFKFASFRANNALWARIDG